MTARSDQAEAQREQRRGEILDAAKAVFAERGYHAASINKIIERADIARGTFYLYFTSKETVFDAILDEALLGLTSRILPVQIGPGAPSPRAQLEENLTRVLAFVLADRPLIHLLLEHGLAPGSEGAARVDAFFEHVRVLIEASLTHGVDMGLVRPCRIDLAAAAVLGAVRGVIQRLVSGGAEPDPEAVAGELIAFALGAVLTDRAALP